MTPASMRFDAVLAVMPPALMRILKNVSDTVKNNAQEVRIRKDKPLSVVLTDGICYVSDNGRISYLDSTTAYRVSGDDVQKTFMGICANSVYSFQSEINRGYITFGQGHRAGICGTAVMTGDEITNVRYINSVNIRIAKEYPGCADELMKHILAAENASVILAGAPGSGKTTLLRDAARQLSDGVRGKPRKVAVVDERNEIAAATVTGIGSDIGKNTDVLSGYPKAKAIEIAIRSLSPEYIICDEISSSQEAKAVAEGLNCGVGFILSVHSSGIEDFKRRPVCLSLASTGEFDSIVFLSDRSEPCKIKGVYNAEEINVTVCGGDGSVDVFTDSRKGYLSLSSKKDIRA